MKNFVASILAVLTLFCSVALPVKAEAAEPDGSGASICSSDYIGSYNVFAQRGSSAGKLDISFLITSPIKASKIGVSKIEIYKDLNTYVTTIYGSAANGLQDTNIGTHGGTYTYRGTAGPAYYAKVTVFASDSDGSDSRTVITPSITV